MHTILVALFVVLCVLVTGLAVLPSAVEQADAKCEGFKNNGDPCKPKKGKHNS